VKPPPLSGTSQIDCLPNSASSQRNAAPWLPRQGPSTRHNHEKSLAQSPALTTPPSRRTRASKRPSHLEWPYLRDFLPPHKKVLIPAKEQSRAAKSQNRYAQRSRYSAPRCRIHHVIFAVPAIAMSDAGMSTCRVFESTYRVVRFAPRTRTTAPGTKLEPDTVSTKFGPLTVAEAGRKAVIAGSGLEPAARGCWSQDSRRSRTDRAAGEGV
jgi:hypothetical protein